MIESEGIEQPLIQFNYCRRIVVVMYIIFLIEIYEKN